jgi:hypothetical protein
MKMSHSKEIDMQPKRRGRPPKSAQQKAQAAAARRDGDLFLMSAEVDALRFNLTKSQAVIEYLEGRLALIRDKYEDTSI